MIPLLDSRLYMINREAMAGKHLSTVDAPVPVALKYRGASTLGTSGVCHDQTPHRDGAVMRYRPRERILENLESIYREAYQRAKAAGDQERMMDLDASYQREQLILEVLLDLREALVGEAPPEKSALEKLEALRRLTRLR